MSSPINVLRFGDFSLDLRQRALLYNEDHVSLTPKAFDILLFLVENRGYVVSKDDLMKHVWGEITVEESNISKNISFLRKTLANGNGENGQGKSAGENDKYIVTHSKLGYRFVHPVEEITVTPPKIIRQATVVPAITPPPQIDPPAADSVRSGISEESIEDLSLSTLISSPPQTAASSRRWMLMLFVAGIVCLAAFAGWKWLRKAPADFDWTKASSKNIVSWRDSAGTDLMGAKSSPDGNCIAFSRNKNGQSDIFIQQLSSEQPLNITKDKWPDYSPVWSPDVQSIAYLSSRENQLEIWTLPYLGGTGRRIGALEANSAELLAWSKDGSRIFYHTYRRLLAVDVKSGQSVTVLDFGEKPPPRSRFSLSPDEKSIAYIERVKDSTRVFIAPLDGGAPMQLTGDDEQCISPFWFPDSKRILYSSKQGDAYQLMLMYLDGRRSVRLTNSHENDVPLQVSPDGRKIIYLVMREEGDIYQWKLETSSERQLTTEALLDILPQVSPDGGTIAFQHASNQGFFLRSTILMRGVEEESNNVRLVADAFDVRWAPSGDRLAFLRDHGGVSDLWTARADGADIRQLTQRGLLVTGTNTLPYDWAQPYNYSWSPKGDLLAFSFFKSGVANIFAVSAKSGVETEISANSDPSMQLLGPMWSPDGKRLVYLTQSSTSKRAARNVIMQEIGPAGSDGKLVVGQAQTIFQTDLRVRLGGWSADGKQFLVGLVIPEDKSRIPDMALMQIAVDQRSAKPAGQLASTYFSSPHLSPDGKAVAYISRQDNCDNIWLLTPGSSDPKKLTTNTDPQLHYGGLAWMPDGKGLVYSRQTCTAMIFTLE